MSYFAIMLTTDRPVNQIGKCAMHIVYLYIDIKLQDFAYFNSIIIEISLKMLLLLPKSMNTLDMVVNF